MRRISDYRGFAVNERSAGDLELFRLVNGVVDLSSPGRFYVGSMPELDPGILKRRGGELFVLKVTCPASNIDEAASDAERARHGKDGILVVKDEKKCELVGVEPYQG